MSGIRRDLQTILESKVGRGKVLLLIGPRQVGKTTLLKSMMEKLPPAKTQFWNCDESEVRKFLSEPNSAKLRSLEMLTLSSSTRPSGCRILASP